MKILTIVGARPQFIKAAALSREFNKHSGIEEVLLHTGQHFDHNMSDVFFDEMDIRPPAYNLEINDLNHGAMTGRMLEGIEQVILKEKPDLVLVYGDTNSTLAGAQAACKLHIPLGHVEAGLRSFNMQMPEEINRILTDRISNLLFCPTDTAVAHLRKEGFGNYNCHIIKSGDVMQDAALYYARLSEQRSTLISDLGLDTFVLTTLHRAENTDDPVRMSNIVAALNELHRRIPVLLPLHPRTARMLDTHGLDLQVMTIDPVGYFDMIELLKHCNLVITDSGGLQKEAFFFGKHCVTMRDQTEWLELVEQGFNVLAGADRDEIVMKAGLMMDKQSDFDVDLYGRGKASSVITDHILDLLSVT